MNKKYVTVDQHAGLVIWGWFFILMMLLVLCGGVAGVIWLWQQVS